MIWWIFSFSDKLGFESFECRGDFLNASSLESFLFLNNAFLLVCLGRVLVFFGVEMALPFGSSPLRGNVGEVSQSKLAHTGMRHAQKVGNDYGGSLTVLSQSEL